MWVIESHQSRSTHKQASLREAIAAAFAEMTLTDRLMSSFDPSALNVVNRSAGQAGAADLLALSERRARTTITAGALTSGPPNHGFFGGDSARISMTGPSPLSAIGGNIVIDPAGHRSDGHPRARIDRRHRRRHALDRAALVLRARASNRCSITGTSWRGASGGVGWKIGIQDPANPRSTIASFA